jgi:beta-galactosidase
LDTAGYVKPRFAYRKALWTKELCAGVAVGKADELWHSSFVWTGTIGERVPVLVFTNGDRAILTLNGNEICSSAVDESCTVSFEVPYTPGTLTATCMRGTDTVTVSLTTPGEAVKIEAVPDADTLPADGQAVCQVEVALRDALGNLAATSDRVVTCKVLGDAQFLGFENGCATDLVSYASAARSTYQARAIVYVRAGRTAGKAELHLYAPGLCEAVIALTMTGEVNRIPEL